MFGAGSSGALDCCRERAGLCPSIEDPPDDALQFVDGEEGSRWKFCSSGSPGLDIGKATLTVCVRTPGPRGGRRAQTRTFSTMTRSLQVMRDWLVECGVTVAAMESTSTYWKGAFYCLEEVMEVWLVNAAHIKAISRRKTDVKDAEWIAQLLECGLLRPSFVPPPDIRRLRMLTRYRVQLMGDRTREITRLELMLEDASVKLSSVAASLTSVSARAMLGALIDGEDDPRVLAELAKGKMRRKIPALTEALTGHFDAGHAQLARGMLARISSVEAALAELNAVLAAAFSPWAYPARPPHGNKWLTAMLVEAAGSVGRMKGANYLAAQHARLSSRRGRARAQLAVGHSILVSAYWMPTRDEPYQDLGPEWLARRNDEAHARRLVSQLERLGHTVVLDPVA